MMDLRKTFPAVVIGNALVTSEKKNTPGVNIACAVETKEEGRVFYYGTLWLSYAALERSMTTLREVFEWSGSNISDFNEPMLEGKECSIVVEFSEEYKPKICFFNKKYSMEKLETEKLEALISEVQPMVDKFLAETDIPMRQKEPVDTVQDKIGKDPLPF